MRKLVVLAAGSAAFVGAVAAGIQGVTATGDDGGPLSVATMSQPVGDTSQFMPCFCPICTQMRDASDGALVPVHVSGVAVV